MTIETNLKRIADALESIAASQLKMVGSTATAELQHSSTSTQAPPALKPATTQPPPAESTTTQPPPAADMTIEEVNTALMVEYKRLGNDRSKIDAVMAAEPFCVKVINELHPSKFADLIAAVKQVN